MSSNPQIGSERAALRPDFIDKDTVARMIGLADGRTFLRQRTRLEREADFPRPMPTTALPRFWRRSAVEGWLMEQGQKGSETRTNPAHFGPNVVLMQEARTA